MSAPAKRSGHRAVRLLGASVLLALAVLCAPGAGAQEGVVDRPSVAAQEIPVTLGQPGSVRSVDGWLESGPAVPLLAMVTLAMLGAGSLLIVQRCRQVSAGSRRAEHGS